MTQNSVERGLYGPEAASVWLGDISVEQIRLWCRQGKIRAVKVGKQWRIPVEELERIASEGLTSPCLTEAVA